MGYYGSIFLAPYESTDVTKGACVRTWTSPTNTGYYSFYGATRVSDVDICKTKDETTCAEKNQLLGMTCTWVALQACTADTFTETSACDQQGHTDVPYPTNGKKTKFFVSGDADTCSRHTLTNPMCGDGRCDAVYTWNCVAPFCDPLVDYSSTRSLSGMKMYYSKVSEKTTCSQDCAGADACDADGPEVLLGIDLSDNGQSYRELIPKTATGAVPIIQAWDGALSKPGDKSNSPARMFGRKYVSPGSDLFATGNGALAFLRHTCDGKLGINMGNGLHLALQIPKLPDFVQKFSSIVKDIQSCRQALNGAAELTTAQFRNKWSLWTLDPMFQRLTTPTPAAAPTMDSSWSSIVLPQTSTKLKMPATCTQGYWSEAGRCRLKFTGLKILLSSTEPEDLFVEIKRCPAPNAGSLPAFSIVADGPQLKFSAPIKFCTADTECNTGLKCVDIAATAGMANIFQDRKLSFTPKDSVSYQESQTAFSFPLMSDPISALVFGQRNGAKNTCSAKPWYGKGTQRAIRHMIRRANNGPSDGLTDLKICVPSVAVDTQKLYEGVQRFIPELTCGPEDSSAACSGERLIVQSSSGSSFSIRGLEATEEEATMYKLLAQYSLRSDGKWDMAAEEGRAFLLTTVSIDEKFTASACTQTNAIRSQIIKKLKANNYNLWQDLEPRHVVIQCTGYTPPKTTTVQVTPTTRRLGLTRRNLATQELQINIQVNKDKEAEAIASTNAAIGSKTAITDALATAGVTDSTGVAITEDSVSDVYVDSSTSDYIIVENLPADLQSAMGDDIPTSPTDGSTLIIIIVMSCIGCMIVFCCIPLGIYLFIYLPFYKKKGNTTSGSDHVGQMNPSFDVVKPISVQAVPVPMNM